jgi:hypothetical protein
MLDHCHRAKPLPPGDSPFAVKYIIIIIIIIIIIKRLPSSMSFPIAASVV